MKNTKCSILLLFFIFITNIQAETIEFWHNWAKNLEAQLLISVKSYEKKTGNTVIVKKVPLDSMNTRFRVVAGQGGGPDVLMGPADWIGQFQEKDKSLILPIEGMVPESKKRTFLPNVLDYCTYNSHIYGLPMDIHILTLVYNKNLIKNPPKTTKEMISLGKKLMNPSKGIVGLVYSSQDYYYQWLWATGFKGNPFLNKRPTFNSREQISAMRFVKNLQSGEDKIMPENTNEEMAISLFSNNKAGMIITGPWEINGFLKKGLDIGFAKLPIVNETGERAQPLIGGDVIMISANSKKVKLCYEFIDYLTSNEVQDIMTKSRQFVPSTKDIYEYTSFKKGESYPMVKGFMEQAEYSVPMPRDPELLVGVWAFGLLFLSESLTTQRRVEDVADEVQGRALKALESYYK